MQKLTSAKINLPKIVLVILLPLFACTSAFSQFKITAGTNLVTTGNVQIVLADLDFYNGGTMNNMASTFQFSGTGNNSIKDTGSAMFFNNITVNKTVGQQININTTLYVDGLVTFISGNIELTDKYILLGSTGSLIGETEVSHATSANYGLINANAVLNAPNAVNIANLGAVITSTANLGNVGVTRTFYSSNIATAGGNSINRGYEFNPTNNNNLNATLTIKYFDSELNGIPENSLTQFESTDFVTYHNRGYSARDATTNYVTQTGYSNLYKFTLSNPTIALPVTLAGFGAQCKSSFIQLTWKTASEQNSDRFDIQRSDDGSAWQKIGTVKAAGNSNTLLTYNYDDHSLNTAFAYYRLAQHDLDGKIAYSPIVKAGCGLSTEFKVMPNPVADVANVVIGSAANNKGALILLNAAGQQVMQQPVQLTSGLNQFHLNMATLAKGNYNLVFMQNGAVSHNTKIIKL